MKTKLAIFAALLIACSGGTSSSGQDNGDVIEDSAQDVGNQGDASGDGGEVTNKSLIEQGKQALGNRAFQQAEGFFSQALDNDPDSRDAKFGLFLADFQRWVGLVNAVLSGYAPVDDIFKEATRDDLTGKDLSAMLTELFTGLRKHESEAIKLLEACLEDPDFRFSIQHYPIYIEEKTRIDLGGTFDRADLLWLLSMEYGLRAIMDFLLSNDLGKDGVRLFNAVQKGLGFKAFGSSFSEMMRLEPTFLTRSKDRPHAFQDFLDDLDKWAENGLAAADALKTKDRPKDAIFVLDQEKDKTLVQIRGKADADSALKFLLVGPKYGLIDSYNKVRAAVAGNGILPFKQGFGVPLVVAVDVLRQVMPLAGIISVFNLPAEYASIIDMIQKKPADGTSLPDILFGTMPLFLFNLDALALDLHAAAVKDFALRDLFAAMPDAAGILPYEGEFMEYDCPRIAIGTRRFVFDQDLKVVLWDLKAPKTVIATVKVYQDTKELDSETLKLDAVSEIPGLFAGTIQSRLSEQPTKGDGVVQGDETTDVIEVSYDAAGTPITVNITKGAVESYAGAAEACKVKPAAGLEHFGASFYGSMVAGLPYKPTSGDDKAYRLWPGAAKGVIYVNPKVLKVKDGPNKFVKADSYLFDVLAKNLL